MKKLLFMGLISTISFAASAGQFNFEMEGTYKLNEGSGDTCIEKIRVNVDNRTKETSSIVVAVAIDEKSELQKRYPYLNECISNEEMNGCLKADENSVELVSTILGDVTYVDKIAYVNNKISMESTFIQTDGLTFTESCDYSKVK